MEIVTLVAVCDCGPTKFLRNTATDAGYEVVIDIVDRADGRTRKASALGLGMPFLINSDGQYSNDALDWRFADASEIHAH